jgi:HD-GYP domain-containing protein (c-di-GMP phosphodiesterase class II)
MPVRDLRIGMFVAKPDCGWDKTPFMLQGILITNAKEILTLTKCARQVTVDPRRSQLKSFSGKYLAQIYEDLPGAKKQFKRNRLQQTLDRHIQHRAAPHRWRIDWRSLFRVADFAPATALSDRPVNAGADKTMSGMVAAEQDRPFREYIESNYLARTREVERGSFFKTIRDRISNAIAIDFTGSRGERSQKIRIADQKNKPYFIPEEIRLVIYPEPEPTYVALPKARAACDQLEEALTRIVSNISVQGLSDVEILREAADTVVDNMIARPDTMMWIAKMRAYSDARYQQALSVALHLTALGRQIGFQRDQLADLAGIGWLLDIGKVTIDPSLLNKPGRLTGPETEIIRTHVQQGLKMFGEAGNLPPIMLQAIAEHHERVDGTGYPNGLRGEDISVYGKMAAIADCFVAMVSPRPYAPTYTAYDAIRQLFREADSHWFRPLVEQFVQAIGIFPVGSLVELSTGEVAIVVQHNRIRRMEPKVLVVTSKAKSVLDRPWDLDMLRHNRNAINAEIRILRGLADSAYGIDFHKYYLGTK